MAKSKQELEDRLLELSAYERQLHKSGLRYIAGVDEVGRGPLAGPVYAAAVILPEDFHILGIDDSKKLSESKREELMPLILNSAIAYGIAAVSSRIIDDINILNATKLAMKQAINVANQMLVLKCGSGATIDKVLVDAVDLDIPFETESIIKGDAKSISIAASSILAKVSRDRVMRRLHEIYPGYDFDKNKGYGTKSHYKALAVHGLSPWHRRTFIHNIEEH